MRPPLFALLLALVVTSCGASNPYRAAVEPQRADVVAAVTEYYGLRNRLTNGLDINDLWQRYPELSYEHDLARGINLEVLLWKWSRDPQLTRLDYKTDLESYQPIRVFVRANEALAYVHGLESWGHRTGGSETRGEFFTVLSLRLSGGTWTVVRTDEQEMGEPAPTDPPSH
jgi:hypothetical protein